MFETPISKRDLLLAAFFSLLVIFILFLHSFYKSEASVIFCDVGQGDAAYIRLKNDFDILIDAGPDKKILSCLGKHMPFYDRSIELAIISHPQKDHYGGYLYLLDRYDIKTFWMTQVGSSNSSFLKLLAKIRDKEILINFPKAGDSFSIADSSFSFFWPTEEFLLMNSFFGSKSDGEFKVSGHDPNDFSLIFNFKAEGFSLLFTGDSEPNILNRLLNKHDLKTDILKVPHHGSKNGLSVEFLKIADPTYAVISVGKNNSYGHPSNEIEEMLEASNVKVRRTDVEGDIVFKIENGKLRMEN